MIYLILIVLFLPQLAFAQSISDQARQQLTGQTNSLENQNKYPKEVKKSVIEQKEENKSQAPQGPTFLVKKINIEGNNLFKSDELLKDAKLLEGKVISFAQLQSFADVVTAIYRAHGYATSRAYIPPQKIIDGVVVIRILEVKVGNINVYGNKWFNSILYRNSLKLQNGDYFEITDLERALREINLQPDRYAQAYLEPGSQTGTTDINMKTQDQLPVHASFEYNNRGTSLTGYSRYIEHFTDNNLTGHGDSIQASFTAAEQAALYATAVHYELPNLRTGDLFHLDFSQGDSHLQKDLLPSDVRGNSLDFIPGYSHNFWDTDRSKLDGDIRFELKDSKTDVQDAKLSFDRTRNIVFGPNAMFTDVTGRSFAGLDTHVGMPNFLGAMSDKDSMSSRPDSGGRFVYWTANAARIQALPLGMSFISQASGQYSPMPLPSIEQMYLGGMYSVRGYPENDSAGDTAFSCSEEVRVPVYFIPQSWKIWKTNTPWRNALSFAAFVDAGRTFDLKRSDPAAIKDKTLAGTGVGLRFYLSPDMSIQFDTAFPFGDTSSDGHHVHLYLSVRVGF